MILSYSNRTMARPLFNYLHTNLLLVSLMLFTGVRLYAQENYRLPLQKPENYKNRLLAAEKTGDTKFTLPRRVFQGMYTHYNYYYNGKNKITAILDKAKNNYQDDYTQLLSFYNYRLDQTAADSLELDSVLYKATAGIVLHDLRNSYIDNLYLLIGQAYFYWQKFDSAYRIFQFINYQFYPKGKNDYNVVVGSANRAAGGNLEISSKEKNGLVSKTFSQPPSRNDALLWLTKTYVEDSLYTEANSLLLLLRRDPYFPKRLHSALNEVTAYMFYKQQQWDSCAFYLEKALSNAPSTQELARWEYLLAQLYSKLNKPAEASRYFNEAKIHTPDPVMYIYARLYDAQLSIGTEQQSIRNTLKEITELARKERFDGYEDILYHAAANTALALPDTAFAKTLLQKSIARNTTHPSLKNKSLLQLATISYGERDFLLSANCYDSVNVKDPSLEKETAALEYKKTAMQALAKNIRIIAREDSLQAITKMPEAEREAYLKSLVKKLRKERGLKEDFTNGVQPVAEKKEETLFASEAKSGEWYFGNATAKAKGYSQFKAKWGNRPNIDNWRRMEAIEMAMSAQKNLANAGTKKEIDDAESNDTLNISIDGLKKNLPFTEVALEQSNEKIAAALMNQGMIFKEKLDDYANAIAVWQTLFDRFPKKQSDPALQFELYYAYRHTGNTEKAKYFLKLLETEESAVTYVNMIRGAPDSTQEKNTAATLVYEKIYSQFIEGRFETALKAKEEADKQFGKSYWTPQLLYIEAVYHIAQRNDSTAIAVLQQISQNFAASPMAEKSAILIDVLKRRKEIEAYLSAADITALQEEEIEAPELTKERQRAERISEEKPTAPRQKTVSLPSQAETAKAPVVMNPAVELKKDTAVALQVPATLKTYKADEYRFDPMEPHWVLILLDKVDPIYISESRGALMRYLRTGYPNLGIEVNSYALNTQFSCIEMGSFSNLEDAIRFLTPTKQQAANRIMPWLSENKYRFLVISSTNLSLLKTKKDPEAYIDLLNEQMPGKF